MKFRLRALLLATGIATVGLIVVLLRDPGRVPGEEQPVATPAPTGVAAELAQDSPGLSAPVLAAPAASTRTGDAAAGTSAAADTIPRRQSAFSMSKFTSSHPMYEQDMAEMLESAHQDFIRRQDEETATSLATLLALIELDMRGDVRITQPQFDENGEYIKTSSPELHDMIDPKRGLYHYQVVRSGEIREYNTNFADHPLLKQATDIRSPKAVLALAPEDRPNAGTLLKCPPELRDQLLAAAEAAHALFED